MPPLIPYSPSPTPSSSYAPEVENLPTTTPPFIDQGQAPSAPKPGSPPSSPSNQPTPVSGEATPSPTSGSPENETPGVTSPAPTSNLLVSGEAVPSPTPENETSPGSPGVTSPAPYDPANPTPMSPGSSCSCDTEIKTSPPPPSPDPLDPPSNLQTPVSPETEVVKTEPPSPPPKFLEPVYHPSDDESTPPSSPYYANALSGEDLDEERYQVLASYQRFSIVSRGPTRTLAGGGGPPFFRKFFNIQRIFLRGFEVEKKGNFKLLHADLAVFNSN